MQADWTSYSIPQNPEKYDWKEHRYGAHSQQVLYLCSPLGHQHYPVLVWFHGGGMVGDYREIPELFWDGTLGIVEVRYRTIPENKTTTTLDALEDATTALAWVFAHLGEFGGDTGKIFVGGMSAGGWLAAMLAMAPQFLAKHGIDHRRLAGFLPLSGQMTTHFQLKEDLHYDDARLGCHPVIDQYAPLYYCSADVPPCLLVTGQGGLDMPGRPEENRLLAATLQALGHPDAHHLILEGVDHFGCLMCGGYPLLRFIQRIVAK